MYQGLGFVATPPMVRSNFRFPPVCVPIWVFFHRGRFGVAAIDIVPTLAKKAQKDPKIAKKKPRLFQTAPPKWCQYAPKKTQKSPKIGQDHPPSLQQNTHFRMEKQ